MSFLDFNGLTHFKQKLDAFFAKINGYYEQMTAGNAEQLVSSVVIEDKVPYNFRTTGGSADVGDRVKVSEITGGTVAWNQLVNTGDTSVTVPNGHKYYSRINSVQTIGASTGSAISINDASEDNVFDLTQMFGSTIADYIYSLEQATEGAGVAWFRKLFPKPYYAYDAGSLQSVNTSAHKMTGFNQWDEEWELGAYSTSDGSPSAVANSIRGKNRIKCLPDTRYYFKTTPGIIAGNVFFYTNDDTFISSITAYGNNVFITPSNCAYMRISMGIAYGTTYNHDVCINLHWDGERDGEYEPYVEYNYPLDSDLELRGIPKRDANNNLYYDGDSYAPDGTVTRKYGVVDLGTLNYIYNGTAGNEYFYTNSLTGRLKGDGLCLAPGYVLKSYESANGSNMSVGINTAGTTLKICNLSYSDKDTFKTAMSGVYLVYELATPTTESADPYQETQVCNDFGTEEFVDSRTVPMPVGANALYQANLRAKLEMAPDSPDGDGDYIVRQTDGLNEYVLLEKELPSAPAEDGTYILKVTIADGTATKTWVAEE